MGDTVVLQKKAEFPQEVSATKIISEQVKNNLPTMAELKKGSFANVGVVKSICKQVQTAAYQGSNHGISATGGFTSHGYSCRNRVSFVN